MCEVSSAPHTDWATIIIGLAAAFITVGQLYISRYKLRLDLFEKRYAIYEILIMRAIDRFNEINAATKAGAKNDLELGELRRSISEAHFLFGSDVISALKRLEDCLGEISSLKTSTLTRRGAKETRDFDAELMNMNSLFVSKYLNDVRTAASQYLVMRAPLKRFFFWD